MKKFHMIDEEFTCVVCKRKVSKANYTARDHCPYCLSSLHVDIMPGDRMNPCKGILKPIGIEKFRDSYKIIYRCEKCHELHKNIMASDDNMDLIIELSTHPKEN